MSDRFKYSLNGIYRCENFAQHAANDNLPRRNIGQASEFHWFIRFKTKLINGSEVAYPFVYHYNTRKTQVRVYLNIIKKDGSTSFKKEPKCLYLEPHEGFRGYSMNIGGLLVEEYGYLDDGALTVEYGLQVVAEEGEDGIWMFNFHDKFFEWQTEDHMFEFTFEYRDSVFSHKQIIKLHSTTIDANKNTVQVPNFLSSAAFLKCLQITHGVRLQMDAIDYRNVARVAFYFGFSNTVRYCERQLIEKEPTLKINLFKLAVKFNMRSYLVHLLKQIETNEHLVKIMRGLNLENMPSESMKAIVAKIFSL